MTVDIPPDIHVLRRLIRGELNREDRIAVDCWLGRCADDRVINLLENLILEWEQVKADERLQSPLRQLSERLRQMWEWGSATIDRILPASVPQVAVLGVPERSEGLYLRQTSTDNVLEVEIVLSSDAHEALLISVNDLGEVHLLCRVQTLCGTAAAAPQPVPYRLEERDGRVTFWLAVSPPGPSIPATPVSADQLLSFLRALEDLPSVRVYASRVTSPDELSVQLGE